MTRRHRWTRCFAALPIAFALALIVSASDARAYTNGFPSDPGFFPVGVWLQSPANAGEYRQIGINTFVGLYGGPTEAQLAQLANSGMLAVAAQNAVGLNSVHRDVIRAWMQGDEPDNAQPSALGYGPCIAASEVSRRSRDIKLRDETRPVLVNFGRGVADPAWPGRGTCTGDRDYYAAATAGTDILSFDIYPVGSDTPHVKGKLEYVASGVDFLVKRAQSDQRVWTILETTALDPNRPVTPGELRAEVWMALIHGAKGIVYFVHEWAGGFREDGIFRHPEIVQEVAAIDRTIAALAPILNAPPVSPPIAVQSAVPVDLIARVQDSYLYIFAVVMRDAPAQPEFQIAGLGDATGRELGDNRAVTIKGGVFADSVPGYGVRLYKIPLSDSAAKLGR